MQAKPPSNFRIFSTWKQTSYLLPQPLATELLYAFIDLTLWTFYINKTIKYLSLLYLHSHCSIYQCFISFCSQILRINHILLSHSPYDEQLLTVFWLLYYIHMQRTHLNSLGVNLTLKYLGNKSIYHFEKLLNCFPVSVLFYILLPEYEVIGFSTFLQTHAIIWFFFYSSW